MRRSLPYIILMMFILFSTSPSSALYRETATLVSHGNSDYFYTMDSYNSLYIDEYNYIDVSVVIDYFDFDSYEVYDIELFLAAEDYDGFTVFEYSSGILYDSLSLDGDELLFEFEVVPEYDWPDVIYLFVSGEFSEDTSFGIYDTLDYSDDIWFEMGSVSIYERGEARSPGLLIPLSLATIFLIPVIRRLKTRVD
jgi:hypothetical protein